MSLAVACPPDAPPTHGPPLRILHLLTEPRGGGSVHARDIADAGRARGDVVMIASAGLSDDPSRRRMAPGTLVRAAWTADVIHCHGVRAAAVAPPAPEARIVVTTHGLHRIRSSRGWRGSLARGLSCAALARADRIICVSEDDASAVARLSRRLAGRCVTIRNGVAPRRVADQLERTAARAQLGLADGQPVLLFVGSLIHQKHPELAVAACARAREQVPDLVLLMAGEGPLAPALARLAGPQLRLLGHRDDVDALIAACDVVINTSRWEGLSLALLEALWRGRPVLATGAPGNREAVGEAGILALASADALAAGAVRMLTEPGLLAKLSATARARAAALFDAREMARATLEIHSELVRGNRAMP